MATMFRGYPRPRALRSMPHHGLYVGSCGRIRCGGAFRHFYRYTVVQRVGIIADTVLSGIQRRFTPHCVLHGLHAETPGSSAITETYGKGASVAIRNQTGLTPKSARRLHRSSRPMRRMSEAVNDGPLLTVQNQAEMIGQTVIDCRPPVLPVSIPLSALSPITVAEARGISSCKQSIMDMDTSEITISRIVGFQWDNPGTDVEDELPAPVLSPIQNVAPVIPLETADLLDRLDVSVMPALISLIEDSEVPPSSEAAE